MVSAPLNQSWIGRDMIVTSSPDAALIGRSGLVVDETRETITMLENCLLYTSPSPRDKRQSRMPSSA